MREDEIMALVKCLECGKEISDKVKSCPNCGFPIAKKSKTTFILVLSIIGILLSVSKIGAILCIISLIFSVIKLTKNKDIKVIVSTILGVLGIIFFVAINIMNSDAIKYSSGEEYIKIKGVFNLDPHYSTSFIDSDLKEGQSYIIVVYDLKNDTSINEEINPFAYAEQLIIGDNTYEQLYSYSSENGMYTEFMKGCGYKVSCDIGDLMGGTSNPIRMSATFVINNNDIAKSEDAIIKMDLSKKIRIKEKIKVSDIETISSFDDIFDVENNPQEYQIAYSVYSRSIEVGKKVDECVSLTKTGNYGAAKLCLMTAKSMFQESVGVSVAVSSTHGAYIGEEYPGYNDNAVKNILPDIWDKVERLKEEIDTCIRVYEIAEASGTYESISELNNSITNIRNLTDNIEEYFESLK